MEKNKKSNFFRKIYLWWYFDGKYFLRDFKQGLINLWFWFPIIWKDRNWDDHYIFEVLKFKLKRQAKYIGERNIHTRAKQDARRMKLCVSLIEKIQEETYSSEYMDFEKTEFEFKPVEDSNYYTLETTTLESNFQNYFNKYPLIYKRVINGEGIFTIKEKDKERTIAMNIGNINQERAHKLLFKILEENILGWWD